MTPSQKQNKANVVRHLTTPETVLWCAQTRVEGEYMPTCWANIKTFVRKAAATRIPPSFCLATAYSQHGKHYDWEPRSTREDFPPIAVLPTPSLISRSSRWMVWRELLQFNLFKLKFYQSSGYLRNAKPRPN
ncbi:hypothetical protein B0H14DRAFT_2630571 [Mycena olivaceomarginata]|nr:hypothetical protein B0H14DRAFT_2630571 [Mycena olivaceomarginata]